MCNVYRYTNHRVSWINCVHLLQCLNIKTHRVRMQRVCVCVCLCAYIYARLVGWLWACVRCTSYVYIKHMIHMCTYGVTNRANISKRKEQSDDVNKRARSCNPYIQSFYCCKSLLLFWFKMSVSFVFSFVIWMTLKRHHMHTHTHTYTQTHVLLAKT